MPTNWHVDEGLARLIAEWKGVHPGAVVYTIGDTDHSSDPDVSQHAPDDGGSQPGDDRGEVDAGDFMPGPSVSNADLDELWDGLHRSRDPRILYVIKGKQIFSSVVQPWVIRPYSGSFHGHVHVSMNDKFDKNTSNWDWEKAMPRTVNWETVSGKVPDLRLGDEDAELPGYNMLRYRVQPIANSLDNELPDLDCDGVYGAKTAQKLGRILKTDGKRIRPEDWLVLLGLGQ